MGDRDMELARVARLVLGGFLIAQLPSARRVEIT